MSLNTEICKNEILQCYGKNQSYQNDDGNSSDISGSSHQLAWLATTAELLQRREAAVEAHTLEIHQSNPTCNRPKEKLRITPFKL